MEKEHKTHRYWTNKYWSVKPLKTALSEIITPEEIDMSSIKLNDELNPLLWEDDQLKPDIRSKLLLTAIEFIKYCKIEDKKFQDILLVGSSANYNYTQFSDIDIHVLMDFDQIDADPEIVGEFFRTKKELWEYDHNIIIADHEIELYIQNSNEPYSSMGVYSLMKNEWIRKPLKKFINVDETDVQLKAADIMNKIDSLVDAFNKGEDITEKAKFIKDKIMKMRQAGLYKEGEFSPENLTFKILRNSGYMDKLKEIKNASMDRVLSVADEALLTESKRFVINEKQFIDLIESKKVKNTITFS